MNNNLWMILTEHTECGFMNYYISWMTDPCLTKSNLDRIMVQPHFYRVYGSFYWCYIYEDIDPW